MEHPSGWTCEVVIVRIELYLLGTLSRAEALALAEHVEACAGCAQRLTLWRPAAAGSQAESRGRRG